MKKMMALGFLMFLFACTHVDAAKSNEKEVEPDYTKGENPEGEKPRGLLVLRARLGIFPPTNQ